MADPHRFTFEATASNFVEIPNTGQTRDEAIEQAYQEQHVRLCHSCAGQIDLSEFELAEDDDEGVDRG
ncbi:hypothetical protein ACWESM_18660 [Nocardia sp. NPDC003999]